MKSIPRDDRLPRYQRLRDDLAARIVSNEWRPGDPIPSEAELGAHYGVAIGTVRKAIDQLVADAVLERQQGRGTFVRRARFNSSLFRFFRFQSGSSKLGNAEGELTHIIVKINDMPPNGRSLECLGHRIHS